MLHLQHAHGISDDGLRAQIARVQDVGDVAVHEDVAGLEAEDGGLRAAGVGAAEPEDLGLLALGEGGEEVRVGFGGVGGPVFVLAEAARVAIFACEGEG